MACMVLFNMGVVQLEAPLQSPLIAIPDPAPQKARQVMAPPLELFKTVPTAF